MLSDLGLALKAYRDILVFRGRSTRTEMLAFFIAAMLLSVLARAILGLFGLSIEPLNALGTGLSTTILAVAVDTALFLPMVALLSRRAHDFGWSGWPSMLLGTLGLALSLWHGLGIQMPAAARIYPDWLEYARGPGVLGFYATLLWRPSPGANRFGPDPRLDTPEAQIAPSTR
ncbi:MAG: DUF805 domain-containing protein [Pseudomonadota bacterium]